MFCVVHSALIDLADIKQNNINVKLMSIIILKEIKFYIFLKKYIIKIVDLFIYFYFYHNRMGKLKMKEKISRESF